MSDSKNQLHQNIIWVKDPGLAMCLYCRKHQFIGSYMPRAGGAVRWLFNDTQLAQQDIAKYKQGRLYVYAHLIDLYQVGNFFGVK